MEQLLIFPFNGNGLEALDCIGNQYEFIGFVDDTITKQGKNQLGFEVFGREAIAKYPNAKILAVPGSPTSYTVRDKIIDQLNVPKERYATLIHPKATVSPFAKVGVNSLIMAGVVITSNAVLGDHVCVLPNTVIHHDSSVGDYTLIGSNVTIAGNTSVGSFCYIGSGTSIINGISVGHNTLIGMGTNVVKSLPSHSKAIGNPARQL